MTSIRYEAITPDEEDQSEKASHPTSTANFLSLLTFWWINSIFKVGNKRPLDESDFLPLHEKDRTRDLTESLQKIWNNHVRECNMSGKTRPKLWKCVYKTIGIKDILLPMCFWLTELVFRVSQPLVLGFLLEQLSSAEINLSLAYSCCVILTLSGLSTTCTHYSAYMCDLLGMRLSSAIKGIIYLKIPLITQQRLLQTTTGNIIDLISNDVQRIELAPRWICTAFLPLLEFIAIICLLFIFIGWQAITGILFLILVVPCVMIISSVCAQLRLKTAEVTDLRISLMNELVSGIRVLKTHAWEEIYREKVRTIRRKEVSIILKKSVLLSIIECLSFTSGTAATFFTVLFIVLTGHVVSPARAFMLLAFMSVLRLSISRVLPALFEIFVSLGRIENFLLLDNMPSDPLKFNQASFKQKYISGNTKVYPQVLVRGASPKRKFAIDRKIPGSDVAGHHLSVADLTCNLNGNGEKYLLRDVSFEAPEKSLTVITGQIGSGKSTLLSTVAGEVTKSSGKIVCYGTTAYVSQTAWVFSGTLRENVLFGEPYDEKRYAKVIRSCALREDINRFTKGDLSFIGEHGVVLSGGQRARVNLARAVYADADVYLLDDPLSAVDAKVGEHIFKKCICKLLRDKIRILVTYEENHMKVADQVVVLKNGHVLGKGSFRELQHNRRILDTITNASNTNIEHKVRAKVRDETEHSYLPVTPGSGSFDEHLEIEDKATGKISCGLYWKYFKAGIHPILVIPLVVLFLAAQAALVLPDVWLSYITRMPLSYQQDMITLGIYASLVGAAFLFAVARAWVFFCVFLRSAENFHDKMVTSILKAPVLFFDTNPAGRILNRCSKDIGCIDELLPKTFLSATQLLLFVFTAALLPSFTNFWLFLVFLPVFSTFVYLAWYYLNSSRELKRWESICCSPVFSHFSETMAGLDTIRTRKRERDFIDQFYRHQDLHNQVFSMVTASTRWLAVRADLLCSLLISAVAFSSVLLSQNPALAGLALAYVIETAKRSQYAVRQFSEVENLMTSVERVMTYTSLDSEPGYDAKTLPPTNWPTSGHVSFKHVALRYYPGGPQVLKNLSLEIRGKKKLGIVGRTGDGKSSIVAALLRMPEADGEIVIDGVSLNSIQLQESRKCISVLSQTPVLFSESLRRNLDPLQKYRDDELWNVLRDVKLKSLVKNLEGQLDYELIERGENLSVGERQLICLARTLLQQSKIVILDEPTAHVDPNTEKTIWTTVHDKLKNSTVITIAHRLNTIKDCDQILVLKEGQVAELDTLEALMDREGGIFYNMAKSQNFSA